jgi:hypothetical protein
MRTSLVANADIRDSLVGLGCAVGELLPITATLACACAAVTPGFSRPLTNNQRMPRRSCSVRPGPGITLVIPTGSTSSACPIASHNSGVNSGMTPVNSGRATPTMV